MSGDGVIVGWSSKDLDPSKGVAFIWRDGKMTTLPDVGGPSIAFFRAPGGAIVGQSTIAGNSTDVQPLLWSGSDVRILAKLPGDSHGVALAVNARGDIVGYSDTTTSNSNARALIWRGCGDPVRIDSLAPMPEGLNLWHGVAINDRGQILAYGGHRGEGPCYFLLTPRR